MSVSARQVQKDVLESAAASSLSSRIGELRRLMVEATDLERIEEYFGAALVPDDTFMGAGVFASHEVLISIARLALKAVLSDTHPLDYALKHLAEHHLWHGSLCLPFPHFAQLIYFDDVKRGLVVLQSLTDSRVHYMRFSVPEGMVAPTDPDKAEVRWMGRRMGMGQVH